MEPQTGAKPGKGHHPNSRKNLKTDAGPGRSHGSRNRFSKEAIARFVDQYRNDLAADWNKHGEAFVAKCREMFPQIYATMQRMRLEDELSRAQADAAPITISWLANDATAPESPAPREPLQIPYRKPEPGALTQQDWAALMPVLDLIKRTIPSNSDSPPAEVFDVIRKALLAHFRETTENV